MSNTQTIEATPVSSQPATNTNKSSNEVYSLVLAIRTHKSILFVDLTPRQLRIIEESGMKCSESEKTGRPSITGKYGTLSAPAFIGVLLERYRTNKQDIDGTPVPDIFEDGKPHHMGTLLRSSGATVADITCK